MAANLLRSVLGTVRNSSKPQQARRRSSGRLVEQRFRGAESTVTNGRRLLRSKLRHLLEVIVHAGFDDVLTLCDRSRHLYSRKSSQSRPGEPGIRPYRGVERACAKVDVVIFNLR